MKKQIINRLVGPVQKSTGPYANRIGERTYVRSIGGAIRDFPTFLGFSDDAKGTIKGIGTGTGVMRFARPAGSVTDFEGVIKTTKLNELRFQDARRVENIAPLTSFNDDDWTTFTRGTGVATKNADGSFSAESLAAGDGAAIFVQFSAVIGEMYQITADFSEIVNSGNINNGILYGVNGLVGELLTVQNGDDHRYSLLATVTDTTPQIRFGLGCANGVAGACSFVVKNPQIENVTGQTNQNPGERVTVGRSTGTDQHGDFTDTAVWTMGPGWAALTSDQIEGTAATDLAVASMADLMLVAGKTYLVEVVISDYVSGDFHVHIGVPQTKAFSGNGYDSDVIISGGPGGELQVDGGIAFTGKTTLTVTECDHGAFVDGVKYFAYENDNTVNSGGVVTESRGADLTTNWGALFESTDDATPFTQNEGNIDPTKGTLLGDFTSSVASAALPSALPVVTIANEGNNLFRLRAPSPQLRSFDGTSAASAVLAFAADNVYRFAVRWDAATNEFQVGYRDLTGAGTWQWGAVTTFDGSFTSGSFLNVYYLTPSSAQLLRNLTVYSADIGVDGVEEFH